MKCIRKSYRIFITKLPKLSCESFLNYERHKEVLQVATSTLPYVSGLMPHQGWQGRVSASIKSSCICPSSSLSSIFRNDVHSSWQQKTITWLCGSSSPALWQDNESKEVLWFLFFCLKWWPSADSFYRLCNYTCQNIKRNLKPVLDCLLAQCKMCIVSELSMRQGNTFICCWHACDNTSFFGPLSLLSHRLIAKYSALLLYHWHCKGGHKTWKIKNLTKCARQIMNSCEKFVWQVCCWENSRANNSVANGQEQREATISARHS